jgi:hypothetical protein
MFTPRRKKFIIAAVAGLPILLAVGVEVRNRVRRPTVSLIAGAVIAAQNDVKLQRPISNAKVAANVLGTTAGSVSEVSGLFRLKFEPPVAAGEPIQLTVTHPDYRPFVTSVPAGEQNLVIRLTPAPAVPQVNVGEQKQQSVSNIRIRYTTRSTAITIAGTAVRTLTIRNRANVPCDGQPPCSPDHRWKAAVDSLTLDAGEQKQFRNVRVSCIAGPCPFSALQSDRLSRGGRVITVSVKNWSDPVTYLLEAEVMQTTKSETVRYTYPAVFARAMNFTLPPDASGLSIECDLNGSPIVFPLGPQLRLSWATCRLETGRDDSKQIQCHLKPGYRFIEK